MVVVLDMLDNDADGSTIDPCSDMEEERPIPMLAIAKLIDSNRTEQFETTPVETI